MKLRETQQTIDKAQTGHGASDEIIQSQRLQGGIEGEKGILYPDVRPRDEHQEQTDLETEKDERNGENAIHSNSRLGISDPDLLV